MRLNLMLPKVEPNEFEYPKKCPRKGCSGTHFVPRQQVSKKMVDAQSPKVTAWRCECKQCGHVFRVYPQGVSQKQISNPGMSRLIAFARNNLSRGLNLADLMA